MITLLTVTTVALLFLTGFLLWQVREQRTMISQMLDNEALAEPLPNPEMVLTLRVVDPVALAKRESRAGRILADRMPVMATKMVYQEVMKELEEELQERDIEVDMQIEYR